MCTEKARCCPDQSFPGGYGSPRLMEALVAPFCPGGLWQLLFRGLSGNWEAFLSNKQGHAGVCTFSSVNIQGGAARKDHRTCGKVQAAPQWAATACSDQLRLFSLTCKAGPTPGFKPSSVPQTHPPEVSCGLENSSHISNADF